MPPFLLCLVVCLAPPLLEDVSGRCGLSFTHDQGARLRYLPQIMGSGCALLDYDRDGDLDAFLVQGSGQERIDGPGHPVTSKLFRNDGAGTFTDVTGEAGAAVRGWGMGVLAADLDSDGYPEILQTFYGSQPALLRNMGDGTFRDVSAGSGLTSRQGWQTSATAIDLDRDGILDVYLGGYQYYPPERCVPSPVMVAIQGEPQPETLSPWTSPAIGNQLFQGRGGLTFADRTTEMGAGNPEGKTLAAVAADLDLDGWTDLFVANDVTPCALLSNREGHGFEDVAMKAYVADTFGSMGLAVGDYNHDGAPDLFCTRWVREVHGLYMNTLLFKKRISAASRAAFMMLSETAGIGRTSRDMVGWGTAFVDLDGDGWEDLAIVNGHTWVSVPSLDQVRPQPLVLLLNDRKGRFRPGAGPGIEVAGRGAAFGDVDGDARPDLLINPRGAPVRLLRGTGLPQLLVELVGTRSNREGFGARVRVTAADTVQTRERASGESYLSTSDSRLSFGLGASGRAVNLTVVWPSGARHALSGPLGPGVIRVMEPATGSSQ